MWLILGAEGQLGQSLQQVLTEENITFTGVGRNQLDISNLEQCRHFIGELHPSVVVNCAAWTAVDLAEDYEEEAFQINCAGARNIAVASRSIGACLVHISTDYVFSGVSSIPFESDSPTAPVSVYGKSKLCGEIAITEEYPERSYIIRTAWLYSQYKGNFVKTMIRKAMSKSAVRVVSDQIGQPTLATDLARHIVEIVSSGAPFGVFHGTNSGAVSWFELTQEIYALLDADISLVSPVPTSEYPTKAIRPQYSVLSHSRTGASNITEMQDWKSALHKSVRSITATISKEDSL